MNTFHTQNNEEDTVGKNRYECIVNSDTRKRACSQGDDPMYEESNSHELNEQASDDRGSDDGKPDTSFANQHSGIGKRRCTGNATNDTDISTANSFTRTLDANAVDLYIADGSVKVSKTILMEVPYFNTFFSKPWKQPTYSLSDDHPLALRIVLAILHHKPELLPLSITFRVLAQLATICNRYSTTDLILPYVESRSWMNDLWKEDKPSPRSWARWLYVAYVLRTRDNKEQGNSICGKILDVFAANIRKQDGKWCLERGDFPLKVGTITCPSELEPLRETLWKRREKLWNTLLNDYHRQQDAAMKQTFPDYRAIGRQAVLMSYLRGGLSLKESMVERLVKCRDFLPSDSVVELDIWIKRLAFD